MRVPWCLVATTLFISSGCQPAPPQTPAARILPLQSVRFYDSGVAYFERSGVVGDRAGASLPLPPGHIDDALKSLVVLGAGGEASVDGLEFGSSVTQGMARALAGLPLSAEEPITWQAVLGSARGGLVEVRTATRTTTGRLIEVQELPADPSPPQPSEEPSAKPEAGTRPPAPAAPHERLQLLLLTADGSIERLSARDIRAVRPLDPAYTTRLGAALDALSSQGARSQRLMRILTQAKGPVSLGYVAEAPIWRTTYRMVLADDAGHAVLQGWALLHNDTDEDWQGVRVHLVNGRPDSFLVPLAAPRYLRRELLRPSQELSTVPQLLNTTADALYGDMAGALLGDAIGESYGAGGMGLSGVGSGGGGRGEGQVAGSYASNLLEVGNLAHTAEAALTASGALFDYELPKPLDLRARGSALVPFFSQTVTARRITWLSAVGQPARAGVRLANNTTKVIPEGPVSVFSAGGFAGESVLDRLMPGETRFLRFGADLDVDIAFVSSAAREEIKRLSFEQTGLVEHYLRRRDSTYSIENRSAQPKAVCLVLDVVTNATVEGADEVLFDATTSQPVALFNVPARGKVERELHSQEGLSRQTPEDKLQASRLLQLASSAALQDADRDAISQAANRQRDLEETRKRVDGARAELTEVDKDLERLRKHLEALGGEKAGAGPTHPFVKRILDAEDRRARVLKRLDDLEQERKGRGEALRASLEKLGPARR